MQEQASRLIIANYAYRQDCDSKVGEVINGIARAAGYYCAVAVAKNQDWGLTRDARNLAVDKFVGNQVSQYGDGELGKFLDDPDQPVCRFGILLHRRKENCLTVRGAGTKFRYRFTPDRHRAKIWPRINANWGKNIERKLKEPGGLLQELIALGRSA